MMGFCSHRAPGDGHGAFGGVDLTRHDE